MWRKLGSFKNILQQTRPKSAVVVPIVAKKSSPLSGQLSSTWGIPPDDYAWIQTAQQSVLEELCRKEEQYFEQEYQRLSWSKIKDEINSELLLTVIPTEETLPEKF